MENSIEARVIYIILNSLESTETEIALNPGIGPAMHIRASCASRSSR